MDKLLIFYLTSNDRYFVFDKIKKEIEKCGQVKNIKLLVVNSNDDSSYYREALLDSPIDFECAYVDCPQSNYLPKVRYAIEYAKNNAYKYILKLDNDVLIPTYTMDYIIANLNILDNDSVLTLSPTISTGIPSVEYFIDDFFNDADAAEIRGEFKKCVFQVQDGIMDYTPLNSQSVNNENDWNYKNYYTYLNSYADGLPDIGNGRTPNNHCKFYKGIHPIRHGFGNSLINDGLINNRKKFFEEKECNIIKLGTSTYLCDMCFVIRTDNYDRIINVENLTIDGCDEVPINRYSWNNNLPHLVIGGGYAIHITYNWRWYLNNIDGGSNIDKPVLTLDEYELNFINSLYE
jgi:hypothetical protein